MATPTIDPDTGELVAISDDGLREVRGRIFEMMSPDQVATLVAAVGQAADFTPTAPPKAMTDVQAVVTKTGLKRGKRRLQTDLQTERP